MNTDQQWGEGRVLVLYMKREVRWGTAGIALLDARMEEVQGDQFVVGQLAPTPYDWASNLQASVRWDEVAHYVVVDSATEYEKRTTESAELLKRTRDVKWETEPEPS